MIPTARIIATSKVEAERMIEFAKLHVKAALEAATINARFDLVGWNEGEIYAVNDESILNSYPLENIK